MKRPKQRLTFGQMADVLNVELCRGITPTGHYCGEEHEKEGSITRAPGPAGPVIHFADRPMTQASTHSFLRLAARALDPSLDRDEPWRRVYRLNMAERSLASFLHIHNPHTTVHVDRAFVRAAVTGLPNTVRLRKQAFDWARRGPRKEQQHG